MTHQNQCITQFDFMMQLANEQDSVAAIFDAPLATPAMISQKNYIQRDFGEMKAIIGQEGLKQNPQQSSVTETASNPQNDFKVIMIKERLRNMQRIWTAMTKFVASQCSNNRTVDIPLAGKFKRLKTGEDGSGLPQYMFMPHLDFVGSGNFKFVENAHNISPFSKAVVGF